MKRSLGFSVIELQVGMFIFTLLLTAVLLLFIPQIRLSVITRHIAQAQEDALVSYTQLTQEIRSTNLTMLLNCTTCSVPALVFPSAADSQEFHYETVPDPPAPSFLNDPLTDVPIAIKVPNWRAYLIYFVDRSNNLWRASWPACGCTGLGACTTTSNTVACSDLDVNYRLKASALSNYAISTGLPAGVIINRRAEGVVAFNAFSGDPITTTQTPTLNPLRIVLLTSRTYAANMTGSSTLFFAPGVSYTVKSGDTVMTMDSSVNVMIESVF